MNNSRVSLRLLIATAIAACVCSACSTIISSSPGPTEERAAGAEREALKAAAADLARTPWPKSEAASFTERMSGLISKGNRMTRDRAAEVYAAQLQTTEQPRQSLMADAQRHLDAVRAMIVMADIASNAANSRMTDVAVVEQSIADFRETRAVYLSTLKRLNAADAEIEALKETLSLAISDLGEAADRLAETAVKNGGKAYAGAAASLRNGDGGL